MHPSPTGSEASSQQQQQHQHQQSTLARKVPMEAGYSSSPGSETEPFTAAHLSASSSHQSCPRSPKQLQSSGAYSPRYASPPAGSGGKYMVKSKRASWIDGSAASSSGSTSQQQHPAVNPDGTIPPSPSTPITESLRLAKSRKGSMVDGLNITSSASSPVGSPKMMMIPKRTSTAAAAAAVDHHEQQQPDIPPMTRPSILAHKSGSISKLREARIDHLTTPTSSASSSYTDQSFMRPPPKRSSFIDNNIGDTDDMASTTSTDTHSISSLQWYGSKRQSNTSQQPGVPYHERRASSISSVVTDSSMLTDEYYSPASSPRLFQSPRGGSPTTHLERGKYQHPIQIA